MLLLIRLVKWLESTFRYTASRVHMNGRGQKRKRRPMNFVADLPIRFPEQNGKPGKMGGNGRKWGEMGGNGGKWGEMGGNGGNGGNGG